ncbi:phospholipase C, phosphocholine-specific [Gluconobacter wancherniae]|uniref:phosphocholine-specific phospholipase C n=1 Tax=Gluconobacter wancherniae TaxID=1307955 RepID=UPI001B8C71D8|nr:phospholipase C, phosphocholine-specific [Gluconobacter wancherniae]MBS1062041.1 phospholipase C, phosphocholine-specific [Gluconobacter wancherniae]
MPAPTPNRRQFLKFGAAMAVAGSLPENVRKALAIPAHRVTGTIMDVEHVVILMQENRSFDHYFGCMQGVRGYGDPRAPHLPDGNSVFVQPDGKGHTVMPFRLNTIHTSSACIASLDHSWKGSQKTWNGWDCWVPHKTSMTMGHFVREDIPYYYALAEAFTICDSYHCSIFGPTNPNRLFLFSGTSGLAVNQDGKQATTNFDDGNWTADISKDKPDFVPLRWTTYAEELQKAGVSWRVYQEYDNFGDNPLVQFATFRGVERHSWQYLNARQIVPGSTEDNQHDPEGRYLLDAFEHDVAHGTLPQVSWIVPSAALSEHPNAPPGYGEHLISKLMDIFVRHPETWSKTAFILNYDENDGFFDHIPAPVPALDSTQGSSTVSTAGEAFQGEPVGLGPRVPALVISPWTKGGWINSQLFDHTSVLRFLEARFGVHAPNITPWRRAVCGDLTSVFDFSQPDSSWNAELPDTGAYLAETRHSCTFPHPIVPTHQKLPMQEPGQRQARALPYRLHADLTQTQNGPILLIANTGSEGAVFRLHNGGDTRHYTVGAGHEVPVEIGSAGVTTLHGPNGFFRSFKAPDKLQGSLNESENGISLTLKNTGEHDMIVMLTSAYNAGMRQDIEILKGATAHYEQSVTDSDHWYDLLVTVSGKNAAHMHFAGHVENGKPSRTDPLIGQNNS